jgi:hypothetical protein
VTPEREAEIRAWDPSDCPDCITELLAALDAATERADDVHIVAMELLNRATYAELRADTAESALAALREAARAYLTRRVGVPAECEAAERVLYTAVIAADVLREIADGSER